MKWGVRGRTGVEGYDVTLNYVKEPDVNQQSVANTNQQITDNPFNNISSLIPNQRLGLTVKGDLRDLGIYAAFGHYFAEGIDSSSYILGADYSYNLNYYTKVNMQLEYLGLELNNLDPVLSASLNMGTGNKRLDLLSGSLSYPIDDFSSISLLTMANLDDSSLIIIPTYQNTLPGNIDLTLNSSFFLGEKDGLFAPSPLMPKAITSISLSYPF
jgi:hypothetical protein